LPDQPLETLTALCRQFAAGRYDRAEDLFALTGSEKVSGDLAELAEAFGMMIVKIEAREFHLEQTIAELTATKRELEIARARLARENVQLKNELRVLRIEIDHGRKEEEVAEITETDYFRSLQAKVKRIKAGD
jgi:hypothetical protein